MATTTSTISAAFTPGEKQYWNPSDGMPEHLMQMNKMRQETVWAILTPLNISLVLVLLAVVYWQTRPAAQVVLPKGAKPVVFQTFTPVTLLKNNGENNMPVYLAVKGKVYDVTPGKNFYGPGGPYENFAGRDATRGLACQSFDEDMLTKDLNGPLDDLSGLNAEQLENLQSWVEKFDEKYLVVGQLKAFKDLRTGQIKP